MAQTLAYLCGLAGVVAGGLLYTRAETAFAVVVWVLTFAIGAVLMIAAALVRAMASLLARIAHLESDVSLLVADSARGRDLAPPAPERDPWLHH